MGPCSKQAFGFIKSFPLNTLRIVYGSTAYSSNRHTKLDGILEAGQKNPDARRLEKTEVRKR
jgi:hypothetical protein